MFIYIYIYIHIYLFIYIYIYTCIYIYRYTADPTWDDILESCFKAESSKLERHFCHVSVKKDVGALSFEL